MAFSHTNPAPKNSIPHICGLTVSALRASASDLVHTALMFLRDCGVPNDKKLLRSEVRHPNQIESIVKEHRFTLISVDLFDTLVYRKCTQPDRVFFSQFLRSRHLAPSIATADQWVEIRKEAERETTQAVHPHETTLEEIYSNLQAKLGIAPDAVDALMKSELAVEREFITEYTAVVSVLRRLAEDGIRVVVNSDTYLPASFIETIIPEQLRPLVTLLCSSSTRAPKRTGLAFKLLARSYPNDKILHIGDNRHSDGRMANEGGFDFALVKWERPTWLRRNRELTDYIHSLGVTRFSSAVDSEEADPVTKARRDLARRWSAVLYDFILAMRQYASEIEADEIWLLSRDNESIYAAITANPGFLAAGATKYVYTSRAASFPIFAESDPARYAQIRGTAPTEHDKALGRNLAAAYRQILNPSTKKLLVVDVGWRGRIQAAFRNALPGVSVYGFYFSLDGYADRESKRTSRCFVPWLTEFINQAAVECLMGFEQPSCVGYVQRENAAWVPEFGGPKSDAAPSDYCQFLRAYLSELIADRERATPSQRSASRMSIVKSICAFPDETVERAFRGWTIGTKVDASDTGSLTTGGQASWFERFAGLDHSGNSWPAAAAWSVTSSPNLVAALQAQIAFRMQLARKVKAALQRTGLRRTK